MRLLQRLDDVAETDLRPQRLCRGNVPVFAGEIVRRLARPQRQHMIDGFREHGAAIGIEQFQRLGITAQNAGADSEKKPPVQQIVDQSRLGGDQQRMAERQVRHPGAELDLRGKSGERCQKRQAVRNVFRDIGQVLAAEALAVAELVGEHEGLAVLAQGLGIIPGRRMDGHDEEAELHGILRRRCSAVRSRRPGFKRI